MKILWCHEVSYLDKPVYEYQDFPERLAARGHEVEVIDFCETRPTEMVTARISRTGEGSVSLTSIPHSGWPVLKYIEARWRFRRMLAERLRRGSFDIAFVYSVFINGTQTVCLCRRAGIPVVYRVLDAYHRLRPGKLAQAILKAGERYLYRTSDRVLSTNEEMSSYVTAVAGREVSERTVVLDHGVDSRHFSPRPPDQELAIRLGVSLDDRVAVFLGTTYAFSGLVNLVRRMPALLARYPRLKLMIVGAGEQDHALHAVVAEMGLQGHVILTGMVPYAEVPRYLSLAEIALNPFEINDITRDIVPIKILQYQAMALPTLSSPLPDLYRKHGSAESGVVYSASDDPDDFVNALAEMLEEPMKMARIGKRGREFVDHRFSVERAITTIESILATLVADKAAVAHA